MSDLQFELPFDNPLVAIPLPGSVIDDCITSSRQFAWKDEAAALKIEKNCPGGYLQADDSITWDSKTNKVISIHDQPLDPNKLYYTVVNYCTAFEGLDKVIPLKEYVQGQVKKANPAFNIDKEKAQEQKHIIIQHFAKFILFSILTKQTFEEFDKDNSGTYSLIFLV